MIGSLPKSLEVNGVEYAIRTDFRDILKILCAFSDPELENEEKIYVCLFILYEDFVNTNVGGWDACGMRTYLNNTVFKGLPQQWRAMIKEVNILASEGNTSAVIKTSKDKLFLFSQAEVGFNDNDVPYKNEVDTGAEQKTFAIFTDSNSRTKKYYNGEGAAHGWWLRSPNSSYTTHFCSVYDYGSSSYYSAINSNGVAFGFCI